MSLGAVKTWVPGEVLKAADLNGLNTNILNNPITLISPTTGPINFNLQPHTNFIAQNISADPASTASGRLLFQTGRFALGVDDGTVLRTVPTLISTNLVIGQIPVVTSSNGQFGTIGIGSSGGILTVTSSNSAPTFQGANAVAPAMGSRVMGLVGTISSQQGSFAADMYLLRSTNPANPSFTITATSSFGASIGGAAGPLAGSRDIAGAFSSTEVHWYVISTGAGSTAPACIVSSKAPGTGPSLPSSYSAWAYLCGSAYTSASTTVKADHRVRGAKVYYDGAQNIVSAFATTSEVSQNVAALVPSNALGYSVHVGSLTGVVNAQGQFQDTLSFRIVSGTETRGVQANWQGLASAGERVGVAGGEYELPNVGQAFLLMHNMTTSQGTAPNASVDLVSYKTPNGGE